MKPRFTSLLFAFAGLLAASQPLLAAAPKADARAAALVAALQAVSPDPLGGRLGLAASAAGQPTLAKQNGQNLTAQSARAQLDQRAYATWKSSTKS
jgi:hypothetical protein